MGEIASLAVISAGVLGRNIARISALAGYRTILEDLFPSSLRKAEDEFLFYLKQEEKAGSSSSTVHLDYAESVEEAARRADVVIEAVPDELESKIEIFTILDKVCRPATILITTSVQTSVSELARITYRPDKCAGMRFEFYGGLVRIGVICGTETSTETQDAVRALAYRMAGEKNASNGPLVNYLGVQH